MIIPLQIEQSLIENSKSKPFRSIEIHQKQQQQQLSSKLNLLQPDIITPVQVKSSHSNPSLQFRLQKLLKTSPYAQLIKQKSQQKINSIDSYYLSLNNGSTPAQNSSQNNVKIDSKSVMTNNQNKIKRRIHSSMKLVTAKKSFEFSHKQQSSSIDQQTIQSLQDLLVRTTETLQIYKEYLIKCEQEKVKLKEQLLSFSKVQN